MTGKVSFGSWMHIGHHAAAELMASTGFDWLAVDLQHGAIDVCQCLSLVQAIRGKSVVPMARLPYNDKIWIRRALDAGFMGLIIPLISTAEESAHAVRIPELRALQWECPGTSALYTIVCPVVA